ncbi:hypothetical protein CHS0354_028561 [Potamilus streckersoni]|uniref:Programmed cell death 7 n=1 Tax=Potamilus streckersoni TaxID=2493646 RepID=A0AAE0SN91_9BIVA|nr:hypothetical protein CHS0354_028561 [Potamilus streckersoni]
MAASSRAPSSGLENTHFNINPSQRQTYTDFNAPRHVVQSQIPHGNLNAHSLTPNCDVKFTHDPNFVNRHYEHSSTESNMNAKYQGPQQSITGISHTQVKSARHDVNLGMQVDVGPNFHIPNQFHNRPTGPNVAHPWSNNTIPPRFETQNLTGQKHAHTINSQVRNSVDPRSQLFTQPHLQNSAGMVGSNHSRPIHQGVHMKQNSTVGNQSVPPSNFPSWPNAPQPPQGLPPSNIQQFPEFNTPPPVGYNSCSARPDLYSVPSPRSYNLGAENNSTNMPNLSQSNYPGQEMCRGLSGNESKIDNCESLRTTDREWIQHWLGNKGIHTKRLERENHLKVYEAQDKMKQLFILMARLQKGMQTLEAMKTAEMKVWDNKFQEMEQVKVQIEKLKKEFSDEQTLLQIKKKVSSQRQKRERRKRSRREQYEQTLAYRDVLHRQIDKWRNNILQKDIALKQEKELKQEADAALTEVRKKISDMTKMISVLNGLRKLRKLRKDRQERQGLYTSVSSEQTFETRVEELLEIATKQLDTYHAEENALKVMLEEEHEESREKERLRSQQKQLDKEISEQRKIQELLFGLNDASDPSSPLFPFYQYYDQANQNMQALLHIRHEWDMFLVPTQTPGGSRIPMDWVTPTEPTSDRWASALKCNQT